MTDTRLFGTDGMRGPFGSPPLDRETVQRLGLALGQRLTLGRRQPRVVLAGDTRDSTAAICGWLAGSLEARGCEVLYAGVLPSPAVSRLVLELACAAGIVVSASHNPHPDNGIKLIDADGSKWEPESERMLEQDLLQLSVPTTEVPGALAPDGSMRATYLEMLSSLGGDGRPFAGLRVTLDSSNGAASGLAEQLFAGLGAEVTSLGDQPDGRNINAGCGSTQPALMGTTTAASASHVGFAFDGDADRVIFADERGTVRDGDATLFLLSSHLHQSGALRPPRIVATSMSNLGLEVALQRQGISLVRCDVGDRVVVRTLRQEGLLLGGEQSGHIVHLGLGPTGDGMQTALLITKALVEAGRPLSELLGKFRVFPQILHNVRVSRKPDLDSLPNVRKTARQVEKELGANGRLVLRYSGTEPLARVMIEGPDQEQVETLAGELANAISTEIGAPE